MNKIICLMFVLLLLPLVVATNTTNTTNSTNIYSNLTEDVWTIYEGMNEEMINQTNYTQIVNSTTNETWKVVETNTHLWQKDFNVTEMNLVMPELTDYEKIEKESVELLQEYEAIRQNKTANVIVEKVVEVPKQMFTKNQILVSVISLIILILLAILVTKKIKRYRRKHAKENKYKKIRKEVEEKIKKYREAGMPEEQVEEMTNHLLQQEGLL